MIKFNLIHDETLHGAGCFLEVPKALAEKHLSGALSIDTRISDDEEMVYLSSKDSDSFFDSLTRCRVRFEIEERHVKGPSFVRELSQTCWM